MTDRPTRSHASHIETPQGQTDAVLEKYGYLANTFDHARSPDISRQLNDALAEQRASDSRGPNSWMVSKDQPRFIAQPTEEFVKPINREFHQKLMAEDHERSRIAQAENEAAWEAEIAERSEAEQAVLDKYEGRTFDAGQDQGQDFNQGFER